MTAPSYLEDHISQIPALRLLMAMSWRYLTPAEAEAQRDGKRSGVILDDILLDWLRANNHVTHQGRAVPFTESGLASLVRALKDMPLHQGLIPASREMYDLLTLGKSVEQVIDGDRSSYTVQLIDWHNPANNVYHVTDEFVVERRGTYATRRPDIVLFVNGIPLAVIECKRPDTTTSDGDKGVHEGISQMLRNQRLDDEIPHLFVYTQLLLSVSVNDALYGATGTPAKYWQTWVEEGDVDPDVTALANKPLSDDDKARLYGWRDYGKGLRQYFDGQEQNGPRLPTAQDRALYSLARPARLLELAYQFIVYDGGQKKIARHQQYFAIKASVERVRHIDGSGKRAGGVIWHTTGSGKSLTMVMLAKALVLHHDVANPRVVIVTDRIDLDQQIWGTFRNCGKQVYKANSGRHLVDLIRKPKHEIITTVIDKFETAANILNTANKVRRDAIHGVHDDANVFILVDESHRGQYGVSHAKMREVFRNGCYIGFTGTPLLKREQTTAARFGGFIHKYTMRQAVADKAVVPLLYEGRIVDMDVNRDALDSWFERRTGDLNDDQKADLRRKMSRYEEISQTRARLFVIAYDIAEHYRKNWRNTGFKAQLATASKEQAIAYKYALEDERIRCEVVISGPDTREGNEDTDGDNLNMVQAFWKRMMQLYGSEEAYLREVVASFAREDGLEILIVVDKLLVGFDEPRNTVLYIDKPLREHGLLQAIARVNRLAVGKDYGFIVDYRGVLGELNEALQTYNALEEYETEDVAETITDAGEVMARLPELHSQLWALFDPVPNKGDSEALERFLEPEDVRDDFYARLTAYANTLKVALALVEFYEVTPEERIDKYKRDLTFFHSLRSSVKLRYAETINYGEYEQKIRKLLDDHVQANSVSILTPEVNIFDEQAFADAVAELRTPAARADAIANRLKQTATERMEQDPAFYRKFSRMVEDTIQAYREGRLNELDYLNQMEIAQGDLRAGRDASRPPQLAPYADASAYYGLLSEPVTRLAGDNTNDGLDSRAADLAIAFQGKIDALKVRDWGHSIDVTNQMKNALEDLLYEFRDATDLPVTLAEMDTIIDGVIEAAKQRDRTRV